MKRAHQYVQQSRDVVFIDATSSFDRQNTSIFLLSTVMPAGAVPLGVILTSDEQEETITNGIRCLVSILPDNAFFGEGPQLGPSLVMIDDKSAERNALTSFWKSTTPLLCTLHFVGHGSMMQKMECFLRNTEYPSSTKQKIWSMLREKSNLKTFILRCRNVKWYLLDKKIEALRNHWVLPLFTSQLLTCPGVSHSLLKIPKLHYLQYTAPCLLSGQLGEEYDDALSFCLIWSVCGLEGKNGHTVIGSDYCFEATTQTTILRLP